MFLSFFYIALIRNNMCVFVYFWVVLYKNSPYKEGVLSILVWFSKY